MNFILSSSLSEKTKTYQLTVLQVIFAVVLVLILSACDSGGSAPADSTAPTTSISVSGGTYSSTQTVTLSCDDGSGGGCDTTYYTIDGSDPTTASSVYSLAIVMSSNTTLKYFSTDLAGNNEAVQSQQYIIDTIAPTTNISISGGTYGSAQNITLTCDDGSGDGCDTTYYTTDGSDPTTASNVYSTAFVIDSTTTLKYFSTDLSGNSETVQTQVYTLSALSASPVVTTSVGTKEIVFNWAAVAGANSYRLMLNPDGVSGYTQSGTDLDATATSVSLTIPVHLTDWFNARYLIEACNAYGCTISNEINGLDALAAIGYFKASNTEAFDAFGYSVALSGDGNTLAVGAHAEASAITGIDGDQTDNAAANAGVVYVFSRSGTGWSQQAYVKASNTGEGDKFGQSVALSDDGNTLAVGAYLENSAATGINGNQMDNTAVDAGAVYVFSRSGTAWSQQSYVKASNTEASDAFGKSVTLSGDGNTLAVGAYAEASAATGIDGNQADNTAANAGAVYVFSRSGTSWSQQAYIKASNTSASAWFGQSVALSGDGNTLAVGAYGEASAAIGIDGNQLDNTAPNAGAVYVFSRSSTAWSQQAYVKASNTGAGDYFGRWAVALSGDGNTLAVGAYLEDSIAGAVYVFSRLGTTWSQQAYVKASNTGADDRFGVSVALSGDGNTLAVGAYLENSVATGINGNQADNTAYTAGAVYVFSRTGTGWSQQAYVKASNTGASDYFGISVALNNDGNTMAAGGFYEASAATGIDGDQTDNTASGAGAVYLY